MTFSDDIGQIATHVIARLRRGDDPSAVRNELISHGMSHERADEFVAVAQNAYYNAPAEYSLLPDRHSRVRFRPLLALGVVLCALAGVAVGLLVWSLLPPGRYPVLVAIVPASPFLVASWWLARKAGWDRITLPAWARWLAHPVAIFVIILLYLWLTHQL